MLSSDTARQGPRGLPVLIVLTASMLLAGIVWWLLPSFFTRSVRRRRFASRTACESS
jgi:hypothetical protein